jgi:hypothetical protein
MALADLNPRSTSKYLIKTDLTGAEGKLLTINAADSATNGVTTLELANNASDIPVGIVVVGAAADTGIYPGYATSCEIYDTLIGTFDGALAGASGVTAGARVCSNASGSFDNCVSPLGVGDYTVGIAQTTAAAGDQFTIKFLVYKREA